MAIVKHYTGEERKNIADQIGAIFDLPNAGMKISSEGWTLESWGNEVQLKVELFAIVTKEQAEAILNARPFEGDAEQYAVG